MTETVNENNVIKSKVNWALEIFGRIWAIWGILSFAITFLIIFLPCISTKLIKDRKKGQYVFIFLSKVWIRTWLFLVGCPFKVKGKENFIKGKTYVVTCNHNSLLDPTVTCPFIPGANKTIAKMSFAKVPIFGWYYSIGSVLVDRGDSKSRLKSFEDMKKVVEQQMHMLIYPEGTRNTTSEPLKQFYDGAFSLAVRTNTDIIPAILSNTEKAAPANKPLFFLPHKITLEFLPAVSVAEKNAKSLKEEVFNLMYQKIQKQRNNVLSFS